MGARYPRTVVVNHPMQALAALDRLRLPVLVKPNVGGSGAGIVRLDSKGDLESVVQHLDLGPDGTALVQEYLEPIEGAIVRVEVLGGEYLYAIRIVRDAQAGFNLCPADICQKPDATEAGGAGLGACPAGAPAGLTVSRFEAPAEAIETVVRLTRAASIDVGGVEYLVSRSDGRIYYYDVNSTSNFVANAEAVVGFDPTACFADLVVRRARHAAQPAAA